MKNLTIIIALFATVVSYANAQIPSSTYSFDSLSREALQPLKKEIGNAQYVFLGEPDHNQGNIFTAKIELMKMLHEEMNFDIIAFESGFYDLNKSHEAIAMGESIKYAYTNSIFDIWTSAKEFHPFMDYVSDHYDSLKVVGFDSQLSGYYADETLEKDFGSYFDSQEAYIEWSNYIEHLQDYQFPKSLDYDDFVSKNQALKEAISYSNQPNKEDLLRTLTFLEGSAYDYYFNDKTEETHKAKDNNGRDKMMAENFIYLTKKYPNKKIIAWGATAHLMNSVKGALKELDTFVPMGSIVKEQLGSQVYTLAFTGENTAYKTDNNIEDHFFKTGKAYGFLNLKEGDIFQSNAIITEGGEIETLETDWSKVVDGLFFVNQLKRNTFQPYDCGESQLKEKIQYERGTSGTTFSFELENKKETVIPIYYLKDKNTLRKQKGVVMDAKTKEPIPFVNLVTSISRRGVSSNVKGQFEIPILLDEDSVIISSIGYESKKILPSCNFVEIYLDEKVGKMTTLTINSEPLTAESIIKKVIKNIPKNYNQESHSKKVVSESIYKSLNSRNKYFVMVDLDVYDKNGYQSETMFPVRYTGFEKRIRVQTCPIDSININPIPFTEQKSMWWKRGYFIWLYSTDIVNTRNNNFLNQGKLSKYDFEFTDILIEDGKEIYVLKFKSKDIGVRSSVFLEAETFNGTLYINAEDFALIKADYQVVHNVERLSKYSPYTKYPLKPITFTKQKTIYKKNKDGYYYLNEFISETNIPDLPSYNHIKVKKIKVGKRDREEGEYIN